MRQSSKCLLLAFILVFRGNSAADDLGPIRISFIEGEVQALIKDTTD